MEHYPDCPLCGPLPVAHDYVQYGPAFESASAVLLREAGADDAQVDLILGAMRVPKKSTLK